MAAVDAAWYLVDNPDNPMVVTGALTLAGQLSAAQLRTILQERIVDPYPEFRRRVISRGRWRRPHWDGEGFSLDRHIICHTAETPGLISTIVNQGLDLAQAPWAFHLVPQSDGTTVVVAQIHHCLADGVALADVLLGLTDDAPAAPTGANPSGGGVRRPRLAGVLGVAALLPKLLATLGEPSTPLRGAPSTRKLVGAASPHDLAVIKVAAKALGVTINDVLLAAVTGGLRQVMAHPRDLRILVPADIRALHPASRLGNRFGLLFITLPVATVDRRNRIHRVAEQTLRRKRSRQPLATYILLQLVGQFPALAARIAVAILGQSASAIVTNVPGPPKRLQLNGKTLDSVTFWVPTVGKVLVGISCLSYAGQVQLAVTCDAALAVSPAQLGAAIDAELQGIVGQSGAHFTSTPPSWEDVLSAADRPPTAGL